MTDPEVIHLLDGIRHDIQTIGLHGQYEFIRNGFLEFAVNQISTNIDKESEWNYPIGRSQIEFGFRFNY